MAKNSKSTQQVNSTNKEKENVQQTTTTQKSSTMKASSVNAPKNMKKEKEEPDVTHDTLNQTQNQTSSKASKKTNKVSAKNVETEKKMTEEIQKVAKAVEATELPKQTEETEETEVLNELKFSSQLEHALEEVKYLKEQVHSLNFNLKKLESAYNFDIKKVKKTSVKKNVYFKKKGFVKPKPVPEKLAKFIGVETGTELSGPDVTKKVWQQLKDKGLTYEKDKRVFRTNAEVSEVFNVPKSVNKSTSYKDQDGFNFSNLQKFIADAMNSN